MEITTDKLLNDISEAISHTVDRIVNEEAEQAAKRTEERVRDSVGSIVGQVSSWFDYEQHINKLIITVHLPKDKSSEKE